MELNNEDLLMQNERLRDANKHLNTELKREKMIKRMLVTSKMVPLDHLELLNEILRPLDQ